MPRIIRLAPNAVLRLGPPSPDCSDSDTCQITDKPKRQDTSSLKIIIPARMKRLVKHQRRSSSSERSDSELPSVEESRSQTDKSQDKSDMPRLTIKIRPLQHPIPVAADHNSGDGNAQDNEKEETRSLTEVSGAESGAPRLLIRLQPRQSVIATDDNSDDGNAQENEEDSSYSESCDNESAEEYLPPRKRQRRCLEAISNLPSSRDLSPTSASPKHNKGVYPL
ncbi:hypothetical protein DEU56DRAFT_271732 [Suillus clintonianus]|uniref:uncharacterized protein n=1 Tax=Suillus clintonianus TaxID=1904413 RepID=UPI001B87192D|nr:uncharacterized protein DEU56DRAFT_271732 [Suillus clintonianus]KAG2141942.1 hypothetical protein DEU56DRAFT_271732 [Suillus clintonianus]